MAAIGDEIKGPDGIIYVIFAIGPGIKQNYRHPDTNEQILLPLHTLLKNAQSGEYFKVDWIEGQAAFVSLGSGDPYAPSTFDPGSYSFTPFSAGSTGGRRPVNRPPAQRPASGHHSGRGRPAPSLGHPIKVSEVIGFIDTSGVVVSATALSTEAPTGWQTPIVVIVPNADGTLNAGAVVTAQTPNGPVVLTSNGDGSYTGMLPPGTNTSSVTVAATVAGVSVPHQQIAP